MPRKNKDNLMIFTINFKFEFGYQIIFLFLRRFNE